MVLDLRKCSTFFIRVSVRCPASWVSKEHQEQWGHSGGSVATETNQMKGLKTSCTPMKLLGPCLFWWNLKSSPTQSTSKQNSTQQFSGSHQRCSTLYIVLIVFYTLCTVYTCNVKCKTYSVQFTVPSVQCTVYSVKYTVDACNYSAAAAIQR